MAHARTMSTDSQFQVLWTIVATITVLVMYGFTWFKPPVEHEGHDDSVLC